MTSWPISPRIARDCIIVALATVAIAVGAVAALAQEQVAPVAPSGPSRVEFKSLDGDITLSGYLFRPQRGGDQPRPAAVMLHGCSGLLDPRGRFFPVYPSWAHDQKGYVVLLVDSATPRGFGQTCSPGKAATTAWQERPKDAYAALLFLQEQPIASP
jgi:dienelactone hydrolase